MNLDVMALRKRLSEVIRTDAMIISDEDFLITHVPFKNLELIHGTQDFNRRESITEKQFYYDYFLKNQNQHNFILILGDSGSGKSHFIRWLKNMYSTEIDSSKEVVLIINRDQNTLKGALEQLLNSNVFEGINAQEELKKLKMADESLSIDKLNANIIHNFAIEVQFDEEDDLFQKNSERSRLYNFLVDEKVQQYILLKPNGPIERIREKLVKHGDNRVAKDEEPQFYPDDFSIDYDFLSKLNENENRANDKAIRFAEKLADSIRGNELRERVARYLNKKMDNVIQKTLKFTSQDLKDMFVFIRQELNKQGKNLTIFIEDITSFVGIDKAVIESLIVEHSGNSEYKGLCRLTSVVGITRAYYQDSLPDNLKQRATAKLEINSNSLFNTEEDILNFAARYINAIKLDKDKIKAWVNMGAKYEDLPLSEDINEEWCTYNNGEKDFSLFPFSKYAILNGYKMLEEKTPRSFIKQFIRVIFEMYFKYGEKFPPSESELSKIINIPSWKNPLNRKFIENNGGENSDRLDVFVRLWGNGNVDTVIENGVKHFAGLPESAYRVFGLPFLGDIGQSIKSESEIVKVGELKIDNEFRNEIKNGENKITKATNNYLNDLNNWYIKGEKLKYHKECRELIIKFLVDYVDWELEGISLLTVNYYLKLSYLYIQDQNSEINKDGVILEKNDKLYYSLIGLINWKLNNYCWNFEDAMEHLYHVIDFIESVKTRVVEFLKNNQDIKSNYNENPFVIGLINMYYLKTLNGDITGDETLEEIYEKIIIDEYLQNKLLLKGEYHSENWKKLSELFDNNKIEINNYVKMTLLPFYSLPMGTKNVLNAKLYINAVEIYKYIEYLFKNKFDYRNIVSDDKNGYIYDSFQCFSKLLIKNNIDLLNKAVESELQELKTIFKTIKTNFGDSEKIEEVFGSIRGFLRNTMSELKELYSEKDFEIFLDETQKFENEFKNLWYKIDDTLNNKNTLINLTNLLLDRLIPYKISIEKIVRLIDDMNKKYKSLLVREENLDLEGIKENIKVELIEVKNKLESVNF